MGTVWPNSIGLFGPPIKFSGVLPDTHHKFLEYDPLDGHGKYNFLISAFTNPGDASRQNHVMRIGPNVGYGGGLELAGEMRFADEWESHWVSDIGAPPLFERHMKYTKGDGSGTTHAPLSMTIRKDTYYVDWRFGCDKLSFGPNGPDDTRVFDIYGSGIMDMVGAGTVLRKYPNNTSFLQQFNVAGNGWENIAYLDSDGFEVLGGQTFNGLRLGLPLNAGRTLTVYGNDCGASGNQAGGDVRFSGGRGRGTGDSGSVIFATALGGASSSNQTATVDRWKILPNGYLVDITGGLQIVGRTSSAGDPTTTELPTDKCISLHKNTSNGKLFLAANDGGSTIKKVELL